MWLLAKVKQVDGMVTREVAIGHWPYKWADRAADATLFLV